MKRVLVVDDTKNIRLLLTKCLELEGYEVETASNGQEGYEKICGGAYNLVFLDIKLPELSGTEVLRRIPGTGDSHPGHHHHRLSHREKRRRMYPARLNRLPPEALHRRPGCAPC